MPESDLVDIFVGAIVVAALIVFGVFLFVSTLTRTIDKSSHTSTLPDTTKATSSTKNVAYSKPQGTKSNTSQKVIYAFKENNIKRCCPYCDGENIIEAKVCNICRRDLIFVEGT